LLNRLVAQRVRVDGNEEDFKDTTRPLTAVFGDKS